MIRIDVNSFLLPPYYIIPADNPSVADPFVDDHIWTIDAEESMAMFRPAHQQYVDHKIVGQGAGKK